MFNAKQGMFCCAFQFCCAFHKVDVVERFRQQVFDILLSELEPVCSKEQSFVQRFFDLESEEEVSC